MGVRAGIDFLGGLSSVYVADGLFTHYDWTVYGDADREVAFAAVYEGVRLAGPSGLRGVGRPGSNAGAQAIAYDVPVGSTVQVRGHSTGWPPWPWLTLLLGGGRFDQTFAGAAPAVKGEELQGVRSSNPVATSIWSAWLSGYDLATRTGSLSGVTIGTIADAGGVAISISARFDGETKTVFDAAAAVPGGPIA